MYDNIINWNALQLEWERIKMDRLGQQSWNGQIVRGLERIEKELEALKRERIERKDEKEEKMKESQENEAEKTWVDVDPFDKRTYPPIYRRCLFERRDGFRFYGYCEVGGDVVPYTQRTPRFKLIHISRFRIEEEDHGRRR